jgi:hypothetical protein
MELLLKMKYLIFGKKLSERINNYMIKKTDCLLLLTEMQEKGVNVSRQISQLMTSSELSLEILKFINEKRQLDLLSFYEKIRVNHNKKKSNLYINIVKEVEEPQEVLTTLSAMLTQILLFSKNIDNRQLFLKHSRAEEITKVLDNYFKTYDITNAVRLMKLIKADVKALESIRTA